MKRSVMNPWNTYALLAVGLAVAVTSNVAHAATSNLALRIGQAFTEQAQ